MRNLWILAPILLALAGCGATARNSHLTQLAQSVVAAKEACKAEKFATQVQRAECMNRAEQPMSGVAMAPDLFAVRTSTRIALAEKVDKKQITEAEADAQFALVNSQTIGAQQSRANSAAIAAAQTSAAIAASSPVTCNRIGNTTTCY